MEGNTTVGELNPIRYRGYYYDTETELYYLNSRYYDPEVCRFINRDMVFGVNDDFATYNLFVYCGNEPVNRREIIGAFWRKLWNKVKGIIQIAARNLLYTGNMIAMRIGIDTAAFGAVFLNMKKDKATGVYHADFDCWQQYFGYNDLYDFVFDIGTSMEREKFSFTYQNKSYILWAWKGDYINLGAGAELGIYYGGEPHWKADKNLAMEMTLTLQDKRTGAMIVPTWKEKTWWITGFNPKYLKKDAEDLKATFTVKFKNSVMYNKFFSRKENRVWIKQATYLTAKYTF